MAFAEDSNVDLTELYGSPTASPDLFNVAIDMGEPITHDISSVKGVSVSEESETSGPATFGIVEIGEGKKY